MKKVEIQHLFWRSSFGIDIKEFDEIKNKSKSKIISELFSESKNYTPLKVNLDEFSSVKYKSKKELKREYSEKEIQKLQNKQRKKVKELNLAWINKLSNSNNLLREKMTLFWANVFVCRDNNIFFIQRYNNTLRKNALGDFRTFVKAIAKEPSMSKYLNNKQNVKTKPNENFARELMELFTLGIGNYTEQDIKESARAFTGWSFKKNGDFNLRKKQHDFDEKTFFGKTGKFDGDDIIDIILNQKQCARFICTKIYKYFVNPIIDEKKLEEITNIFYKDYNIEKLMKYIFKSNWFYEDKNIGVKIKSPMELLIGIHKTIPFEYKKKQRLYYLQKMMGQILLYPENVAGWKGGKNWIDSNTLMFRMKLPSLLLSNAVINLEVKGEFEDTFDMYYKETRKKNKYIQTTPNWTIFKDKFKNLNLNEFTNYLIISKIDKDTFQLLNNLQITSKKEYCIQLMSIPEYQLC